jgi:hypothetical protein
MILLASAVRAGTKNPVDGTTGWRQDKSQEWPDRVAFGTGFKRSSSSSAAFWHTKPWGKGMGGIRLTVLSDEGKWRIKVGERFSRPFRSQNEAIRAAFDRASALGRDGLDSEVVMNVLTCQFGPDNFFKTVPTRQQKDAD